MLMERTSLRQTRRVPDVSCVILYGKEEKSINNIAFCFHSIYTLQLSSNHLLVGWGFHTRLTSVKLGCGNSAFKIFLDALIKKNLPAIYYLSCVHYETAQVVSRRDKVTQVISHRIKTLPLTQGNRPWDNSACD